MQIAEAFVEVQMRLQGSSVSRAKSDVKRAATQMERDGKITLDADGKPLKSELDKAERNVDTAARSMASTFARVFTGAAVARGLKEAIDSASALGESMNAVNVTFGDAADGVHALGEESATSLGLSTEAFNALAVRFSSFAQTIAGPGGDVAGVLDDMTTRAADFASVMNIDVAQAAELFQSGLAGESEPLRQYGIDLSAAAVEAHALETGINDGTHALTEAEKVQARYSLLMQQTSKVAGDFANTADSAANRQRILAAEFENAKAKLGSALLPLYGQAIGVLTELVEIFTQLPAPVQAGVVAMLGIVAVAGPVKDATAAFGGLSKVIGKLGAAGGPLTALAVATGVAVVAWKALDGGHLNATPHIDSASDALARETTEAYNAAVAAGQATTAVDALAIAHVALSNAISEAADPELTDAFATLNVSADEWLEAMIDLRREYGHNADVQRLWTQALNMSEAEAARYFLLVAQGETDHERLAEAAGVTVDQFDAVAGAMNLVQRYAMENQNEVNDLALTYLQGQVNAGGFAEAALDAAEEIAGSRFEAGNAVPVYEEYVRQLTLLDPAAAQSALSVEGLGTSTTGTTEAMGNAAGKAGELAVEMGKVGDAVEKANLKIAGHVGTAKESGDSLTAWGDAAKDAAGQADVLGDAVADAGPDFDALHDAASEATDEFDEFEDAANRLREAIRKVTGPQDDLRETTRAVWQEFENLTAGLAENGTSYDVSTEAGRANQEQLEETRDAILAHGAALVANGSSAAEAAGDIQYNIDALNEQWRQAGLTEDQIAALNEEYNLTPEDVETVLRLEGEAAAQATLERYEQNLDKIPVEKRTEIEAAIRDGDIARANELLDGILDPQVRVRVTLPNLPQIRYSGTGHATYDYTRGTGPVALARGSFIGEDMLAQLHANEAVLPLGDARRSRLRELLSDPRIGEPIADAMGGSDAPGIGGGLTINGGVHVGSREDVPLIYDAFADIEFSARHG
jgi:hypothetical protein